MAPTRGMEFARGQLLKYGWKEGKGLGLQETGIAEPLKPKLKFDSAGIGHDAAEQFTYHWWEHAFNQAANNINVCKTEDGVAMEVEDESLDITTKKYSVQAFRKNNTLKYGTFLKTSLLTKGGAMVQVREDKPEDLPIETVIPPKLTDEELFKICGGLTAHKGARHGLRLNGKLARIEEQERQLLEQMKKKSNMQTKTKHKKKKNVTEYNNTEHATENENNEPINKRKKKKKKYEEESSEVMDPDVCEVLNGRIEEGACETGTDRRLESSEINGETAVGLTNHSGKKQKKHRKEQCESSANLASQDDNILNSSDGNNKVTYAGSEENCDESSFKKKKKCRNLEFTSHQDYKSNIENCDQSCKKKKKVTFKVIDQEEICLNNENTSRLESDQPSKKKRRKKKKGESNRTENEADEQSEVTEFSKNSYKREKKPKSIKISEEQSFSELEGQIQNTMKHDNNPSHKRKKRRNKDDGYVENSEPKKKKRQMNN